MNEDTTPTLLEEKKEETPVTELPPKVTLFFKYFTDPREKATFGNRTQSAIAAYNLNPETQYNYAKSLGSQLMTRYNHTAREVLNNFGWDLPQLLGFALDKMTKTEKESWWDRVMEVGGYKNAPLPEGTVVNNTQVNIYNPNGKEVLDWNAKLLKFLQDNA